MSETNTTSENAPTQESEIDIMGYVRERVRAYNFALRAQARESEVALKGMLVDDVFGKLGLMAFR